MYKKVNSYGTLLGRVVRGGETKGYFFLDYMTNNKYCINKESAVRMAGNGSLSIRVGDMEDTLYTDEANRLRSKGKLKMKDLPVITEADFIKKTSRSSTITLNQLTKALRSNYNVWYETVCAKSNKYINITDTTYNIDSWFASKLCTILGMHSSEFKKIYEEYEIYSREGTYIINIADKDVYTDLVKITKDFSKDYQLKDFLKYLVDAINKA